MRYIICFLSRERDGGEERAVKLFSIIQKPKNELFRLPESKQSPLVDLGPDLALETFNQARALVYGFGTSSLLLETFV
jgi:hypothetical protein